MLKFLQVFYLTTTAFFNMYIPNNHTTLHNIYEIIKYFIEYRDYNQLQPTLITMKINFMKYYIKKITTIILFWTRDSN